MEVAGTRLLHVLSRGSGARLPLGEHDPACCCAGSRDIDKIRAAIAAEGKKQYELGMLAEAAKHCDDAYYQERAIAEAVEKARAEAAKDELLVIARAEQKGREEEREACAKVLETDEAKQRADDEPENNGFLSGLEWGAAAIRGSK